MNTYIIYTIVILSDKYVLIFSLAKTHRKLTRDMPHPGRWAPALTGARKCT